MKLSVVHEQLLLAMAAGDTLNSQRDVDGGKVFQLHALDGNPRPIERRLVEALREQGLIDSNKKFPAATYWLTDKGRSLVSILKDQQTDRR
jgi:predicted transcriptional regulator with HTH domain